MVRKTLICIALCAALGLSANALAGNNNKALVSQNGLSNTATVNQTQANSSNQSLSNAYFNPGDVNTIDQQGDFNSAAVTQFGSLNNAQIQQIGDNQAGITFISQNGSSLQGYLHQFQTDVSKADISQDGTDNYANVSETNTSNVWGEVDQSLFYTPKGSNNQAYVWISNKSGEFGPVFTWVSHDNLISDIPPFSTLVIQEGDTNDFAFIGQDGGSNSSAVIYQGFGANNTAWFYQNGSSQSLGTIEQHNTNNYALSYQWSGVSESHILQYGSFEQAYTTQSGGLSPAMQNYAEIDQGLLGGGDGNIASITQNGDSNRSTVTQDGTFNTADVSQTGSANLANVTQNGNGNLANVTQVGSGNIANVNQ